MEGGKWRKKGGLKRVGSYWREGGKRKSGSDVFLIEDFSKSLLLTVTSNAWPW